MMYILSPDQLRVAVTGGRKYADRLTAYRWLESMRARAEREERTLVVLHGKGTGLDQIAEDWRGLREVECWRFAADWFGLTKPGAVIRTMADGRRYDAAEGPRRSRQMLDEGQPHVLGHFPGGDGTAACVEHAQAINKAGGQIEIVGVTPDLVRPRITRRILLAAIDIARDVPAIMALTDPALSEVDQPAYIEATRVIRAVLMEMEVAGLVESVTIGRGVPSWRRTEAGERVLGGTV